MTPTPLQMKQLIAAGGLAGDLCKQIQQLEKKVAYQAKTIKVADQCMKEKQATIEDQKAEISGLKDASEPVILDKKETHDLLISAANELSTLIWDANKQLEAKICSTDLDPPEYHDYQSCHELSALASKILWGKK